MARDYSVHSQDGMAHSDSPPISLSQMLGTASEWGNDWTPQPNQPGMVGRLPGGGLYIAEHQPTWFYWEQHSGEVKAQFPHWQDSPLISLFANAPAGNGPENGEYWQQHRDTVLNYVNGPNAHSNVQNELKFAMSGAGDHNKPSHDQHGESQHHQGGLMPRGHHHQDPHHAYHNDAFAPDHGHEMSLHHGASHYGDWTAS